MDTANKFMVGVQGDQVRILRPPGPGQGLSREDALLLAAYLVALAETDSGQFDAVLRAVVEA